MNFSVLNLDAIQNAAFQKEPYPYMVIDNIIQTASLEKVIASFPRLSKRGSFPLHAINSFGPFNQLMQELQSPDLKRLIAKRFKLNLEGKPPIITVRGYTTERDGHIHVDSEDKLITFLLYLNSNWTSPDGKIRVLYDQKNLTAFAEEISPEAGRCLIFQVTKNCWHGHTIFKGHRKSIQMNYVQSEAAASRHLKRHRISAFFKRLIPSHLLHQ
ncbi:MAG TPA: 2OG-Fe(II) oxygenase [Chlamydiales bacterium]|nr:2OG-Fe(II) oxygenase [Chlamydiales bacterium]